MNKLTALVEAAKNSNSDDCNISADALAGWGDDILELCALLEKAEETIAHHIKNRQLDDGHELCVALAAIKQWKEAGK